jgi:hypothetical protein
MPRTAFHQEGKDDEVMTMLGELHGGQGDQQGHPILEEGDDEDIAKMESRMTPI